MYWIGQSRKGNLNPTVSFRIIMTPTEALTVYNSTPYFVQFFFWPSISNQIVLAMRKYFTLISCLVVSPVTLVINAPFGRFAPQTDGSNSGLLQTLFNHPSLFINGQLSWVLMEIFAPAFFILAYFSAPLNSVEFIPNHSLKLVLLPLLFLTHYLNRALISPLVLTPSRSKSHIVVPLVGIMFNVTNGSLLGSYLSSESAISYVIHQKTTRTFWLGVVLWFIGFVGNIYHDEILFSIRRKAKSKGKYKEESGEHYAIPTGGLYTFISYPNYLCEWLEWFGFAIAAAPFPFPTNITPSSLLTSPSQLWLPSLTPPYIFLINLIFLMLPRAYRGHQWYNLRFGDKYPKERRAVIPFVL